MSFLCTSSLSAHGSDDSTHFDSPSVPLQPDPNIPVRIVGNPDTFNVFDAVYKNDLNALKRTVRGYPSVLNEAMYLDPAGESGSFFLVHAAILNQNPDILSFLLESGVDAHAVDGWGRTAAHYAAIAGYNLQGLFADRAYNNEARAEMLTRLHKAGLNLNATDQFGATALHYAGIYGQARLVERLLELGVNPDVLDRGGKTALEQAVDAGFLHEIPNLLRRAGARKDVSGWEYLRGTRSKLSHLVTAKWLAVGALAAVAVTSLGLIVKSRMQPKLTELIASPFDTPTHSPAPDLRPDSAPAWPPAIGLSETPPEHARSAPGSRIAGLSPIGDTRTRRASIAGPEASAAAATAVRSHIASIAEETAPGALAAELLSVPLIRAPESRSTAASVASPKRNRFRTADAQELTVAAAAATAAIASGASLSALSSPALRHSTGTLKQ